MKARIVIAACAALLTLLTPNMAEAHAKAKQKDIVINVVGDVHGERAIKRDSLISLKNIS